VQLALVAADFILSGEALDTSIDLGKQKLKVVYNRKLKKSNIKKSKK
jgi:hypothetical protein